MTTVHLLRSALLCASAVAAAAAPAAAQSLVPPGSGVAPAESARTVGAPDAPDASLGPVQRDPSVHLDIAAEYMDAARIAWSYFVEQTHAETGLVAATSGYANTTTWDIASAIAAIWSAERLGLIQRAEYSSRMTRLLETVAGLPLYDSTAYHKIYEVATGRMIHRGRVDSRGYGWSATDLGRFLVWLAIVRDTDPGLAPIARRIAARMDYSRIVQDGYVYGHDRTRRVYSSFQEGRVGYEQYMGRGFALWGHDVAPMLDPAVHGLPIEVNGYQLLEDERGMDRLLSEPFVMMGLELGWDPNTASLAANVLAVQRARWEETGNVTIASEDAIAVAPNYFYYYCVYCSGRAFVVETYAPGETSAAPRWISTKSTFGWHALVPDDYTALAFRTVQAARDAQGWNSGVFEGSGRPTGTHDINTAAMILEAAVYVKTQRPLIEN